MLKTAVASLTLVGGIALCVPDAGAVNLEGAAADAYVACKPPRCKKHANDDGTVQGCKQNDGCFYCDPKQCWWAVPRRLLGGWRLTGPMPSIKWTPGQT